MSLYAAFASQAVPYNQAGDEFMRLYQDAYGDDVIAPDISDGAVAYDAWRAAADGQLRGPERPAHLRGHVGRGARQRADRVRRRQRVHRPRQRPHRQRQPQVPLTKPVLVLAAGDGSADHTLACGRFADVRHTTWGPAGADCPTVD